MTGPKVVGTIPPDGQSSSDTTAKPPVSEKPSKALPTDRVGVTKQFDMLRGYAAITSQGKTAVTNTEVSELVKIHPNTAILANPFFLDVGFLRKEGNGYAVAPEVMSYVKAIGWNAETAAQKLAPLLSRTWFANVLLPRLRMGKPITEREAIELLADASGAGPRYEGQLKNILSYLTQSGLVRKEGDSYRDGGAVIQEEAPMRSDTTTQRTDDEEPRIAQPREPVRGSSLSTAFSQAPEGVLRFNVDVSVDLKDFATWQPDRITAFWSGIAQVLAAKANVEQEGKR
jgi:hypothetical protein